MKILDWCVVGLYFLFMLAVGLYFTRRAGRSVAEASRLAASLRDAIDNA